MKGCVRTTKVRKVQRLHSINCHITICLEAAVKNVTIYALKDPRSGEVRYVGKTINPTVRLQSHIYEAKKGSASHKAYWMRQLLKLGMKPEVTVLEMCEETAWQERERHWITQFDNLTNLTTGGDGVDAPRNATWRQRMSDSLAGHPVTETTRAKLRTYTKTHCKHGHEFTPENTLIRVKDGHEYKRCRQCNNETQAGIRRARGQKTWDEHVKELRSPKKYCSRGHLLEGNNLRVMVRTNGRVEYVCRECARIRNARCVAK